MDNFGASVLNNIEVVEEELSYSVILNTLFLEGYLPDGSYMFFNDELPTYISLIQILDREDQLPGKACEGKITRFAPGACERFRQLLEKHNKTLYDGIISYVNPLFTRDFCDVDMDKKYGHAIINGHQYLTKNINVKFTMISLCRDRFFTVFALRIWLLDVPDDMEDNELLMYIVMNKVRDGEKFPRGFPTSFMNALARSDLDAYNYVINHYGNKVQRRSMCILC